nr:uncharacterized protein LOC109171666 [Ipomoea batatas]
MGLCLRENFDPISCTLQLQNGQIVHITTDDVAATLRLPMGHIEIKKRITRALLEILKEWREILEKTTAYITPKALTRKMLEVNAADPRFNFGYGHIDSVLQLENAPPEEENPSIPQSKVPHPPQPHAVQPSLSLNLSKDCRRQESSLLALSSMAAQALTASRVAESPITAQPVSLTTSRPSPISDYVLTIKASYSY